MLPQLECRMLRFSPAFCRTFLPGSSIVPFALAVMFLICSPSNTSRDPGASTIDLLVLWAKSFRISAILRSYPATLLAAFLRLAEPFCFLENRFCHFFLPLMALQKLIFCSGE